MFGSFLFIVLATMTSLNDLRDDSIRLRFGNQVKWLTLILFVGGFPIGIWLNYQIYGAYWTGFPVGRDITDSKTLLIFIYWLVLLFLVKGTAFGGDKTRDLVQPAVARMLTIIGALISVGLYLVPHSSGNY